MKQKIITYLFSIALIACISVGCGPARDALKSKDPDLIYALAMDYYEQERWEKAAATFEMVEIYFDGSQREDSLAFYKARCSYKLRDYYNAASELDNFRRTFGRSPFVEDAEGMYALCYYFLSPSSTRDQTTTQSAIITIDEFLMRYPESEQRETFTELRDNLQHRIYEKDYLNAYTYYKIGRYKSAILSFKGAIKRYPQSPFREQMLYYSLASAYELAKNSIISLQDDRFLNTLDTYYTFIAEFPDSEYMPRVEQMAKQTRNHLEKRNAEDQSGKNEGEAELIF